MGDWQIDMDRCGEDNGMEGNLLSNREIMRPLSSETGPQTPGSSLSQRDGQESSSFKASDNMLPVLESLY